MQPSWPPWLARELKPNRKLFPDHLAFILHGALVGAGSQWHTKLTNKKEHEGLWGDCSCSISERERDVMARFWPFIQNTPNSFIAVKLGDQNFEPKKQIHLIIHTYFVPWTRQRQIREQRVLIAHSTKNTVCFLFFFSFVCPWPDPAFSQKRWIDR
jgi:hypothetical protein